MGTRYKVWVVIERQTDDDVEDISEPVDVGPHGGFTSAAAAANTYHSITGEEPEWIVEEP